MGGGVGRGVDTCVYFELEMFSHWERSSCSQSTSVYRGYHMKITLDHNCLIALEKNESEAPYIKKLIAMHDDKKVIIRVVGIGASERLPGGTYAANFDEFKKRIAAVGLAHVEILQPISYWDITFWDWGIWSDDQMIQLERKIHGVLFPNIEFDYALFYQRKGLNPSSKEIDRRWRNAKCDVLTIWSHIYYGGDIFVTNDIPAFLRKTKKARLIAVGAGDILTPQETVAKLEVAQS